MSEMSEERRSEINLTEEEYQHRMEEKRTMQMLVYSMLVSFAFFLVLLIWYFGSQIS